MLTTLIYEPKIVSVHVIFVETFLIPHGRIKLFTNTQNDTLTVKISFISSK